MEITEYFRRFRNWIWLAAVVAVLLGGFTYYGRHNAPTKYTARATIAVGGWLESPNPDAGTIRIGLDLVDTYVALAKTYTVRQSTAEMLDLGLSAESIGAMTSIDSMAGTTLIAIYATHSDPETSAAIANALATQLIDNSPTNLTPEQQDQIAFAQMEIADLAEQIDEARIRLNEIDSQLLASQDREEIGLLTTQRNLIIDQINRASTAMAQFTSSITLLQQRTNSLEIVDYAEPPKAPNARNVLFPTLLSGIFGALIIAGIALVVEYLDDTIRTSHDIVKALDLPIVGVIPHFPKLDSSKLALRGNITSGFSLEAYQTLATHLQLIPDGDEPSMILLTSPGPDEGKTTTSINLAVALAKSGAKVVLLDGDLREPRLLHIFGLENKLGFASGYSIKVDDGQVSKKDEPATDRFRIDEIAQETDVPGLRVITGGPKVATPLEILRSEYLTTFFGTLKGLPGTNVVIIDSPPCLPVSDSLLLAKAANARVLLVLQANRTQRRDAIRALERFRLVSNQVSGVVLNNGNLREEDYYGHSDDTQEIIIFLDE